MGFGASAHLVIQMAKYKYPNSKIFAFARSQGERAFALELGAAWAGDIDEVPPEKLNCAIDTTPVWKPIIEALKNLAPGGRLVINAIRKENVDKERLLELDYPTHLWHEKGDQERCQRCPAGRERVPCTGSSDTDTSRSAGV